VAHASIQHEVRLEAVPDEGERDRLIMQAFDRNAALRGRLEDPLLLGPDDGVE